MPDPCVLLPLAHAGHWLIWVLYAVPVVAVLVAVVVGSRRERRRREGGATPPDGSETERGSDAA
jgi:cytochrome c-type biogenesis protein CcmH/NrfF